jgi:hypothetical protein
MVACGIVVVSLLAGCSTGPGHRSVFRDSQQQESGPIHTQETMDITVLFWNTTSDPVHLVKLSLVSPNPAVHLVSTSVFNSAHTNGFPAEKVGDLPKECPLGYVPSPVKSLTVKPHQFSHLFAVVAIRITRPGRYLIRKIRIDYTTPSGPGWQYWSSNMTLKVSNPPLPGPTKLPADQAC